MICALGVGNPGVIGVLAGWDVWRNRVDAIPVLWFAVAMIGAWGMVATIAWHGEELVYRHGLGVVSLPLVKADLGHDHGHSATPASEEQSHAETMVSEDDANDHSRYEHAH